MNISSVGQASALQSASQTVFQVIKPIWDFAALTKKAGSSELVAEDLVNLSFSDTEFLYKQIAGMRTVSALTLAQIDVARNNALVAPSAGTGTPAELEQKYKNLLVRQWMEGNGFGRSIDAIEARDSGLFSNIAKEAIQQLSKPLTVSERNKNSKENSEANSKKSAVTSRPNDFVSNFAKLDLNGDGKLSDSEMSILDEYPVLLLALMLYVDNVNPKKKNDLLETMGIASKAEFLNEMGLALQTNDKALQDKLRVRFQAKATALTVRLTLDDNKDGVLDINEAAKAGVFTKWNFTYDLESPAYLNYLARNGIISEADGGGLLADLEAWKKTTQGSYAIALFYWQHHAFDRADLSDGALDGQINGKKGFVTLLDSYAERFGGPAGIAKQELNQEAIDAIAKEMSFTFETNGQPVKTPFQYRAILEPRKYRLKNFDLTFKGQPFTTANFNQIFGSEPMQLAKVPS